MNLTKTNWPLGWTPSADLNNGDPNGLVRMDNLQLEESGAIGLVRGFTELGSNFSDFVSDIYSKVVDGVEAFWVGLNNGVFVFRYGDITFSSPTTVLSGGGTRPAFGDGLGQVIACSGTQKKKDDGHKIQDLGLLDPPYAPNVQSIQQQQIDLIGSGGGNWTLIEGDSITLEPPTSFKVFVNSTTLRGVAEAVFDNPVDTTNTGDGPSVNPQNDTFYILIQPGDTSNFQKFRVELYLDTTGDNYYWMDWPLAGSTSYNLGIDTQSILSARRSDFTRSGSDPNLDWTNVVKMRVIGEAIGYDKFLAGEARFVGGAAGELNGYYVYIQVDVNDNGSYQAKSAVSPQSEPQLILNGSANVLLAASGDPQVTESWLFRKSLPATQFQEVINLNGQNINVPVPVVLDTFYRVAVGAPGSTVLDNTPDIDAIQTNIVANQFIISMADLQDPIIGMEGIYNERMLYLTDKELLLSDRLNIDAYDPRYSLKAFGGASEHNLWIKKISNNTLLLATTKDFYEISGTLLDLPDGTIDANVRSIGEAFPPLSQDVTATDGAIFYAAADGWRITTGSNSVHIDASAPERNKLSLLFQGLNRYGIPDFISNPGNTTRYAVGIGRSKFYAVAQCSDGTRRLLIYDLVKQTWRLQYTDPTVIYITKSDKVLLGYGLGSGNNIQMMEFGDDATVDFAQPGQTGQSFFLQTVYDHNGQPRNRKDTFTLKLVMDTGGQPVSVNLGIDGGAFSNLTSITGTNQISTSGQTTVYFNIDGVYGLGFRYAIQIIGTNSLKFKLWEYTIEYNPRPEQNVFYHVLDDNFGSNCRKRLVSYPIEIDTLNHNVVLDIYADGVKIDSETFKTSGKNTFTHYFQFEAIGVYWAAVLSSTDGPFEYYGFVTDAFVSEKLPEPAEFLVIPANDYGTPNRKRHTSYKFQIHTRGQPVQFTPKIDGSTYAPATYTTTEKRTVEYYFDTTIDDPIGIDIGGTLQSLTNTPFEYYGTTVPQDIEVLPPKLETFVIPSTDYGQPNRKRHSSYKFQINTFGKLVRFVPKLDAVYSSDHLDFSTTERKTVEYFFPTGPKGDNTAIDIGGRLVSLESTPFEFYKVVVPQQLEVLPPRLTSFFSPETNFGVAARKRVRTIPIIINTYGQPVTFTPRVDGLELASTTLNSVTDRKATLFHYFRTDVFGIDFAGEFVGTSPFEFYEFGVPEQVEILPVAKVYDQLGPVRYDKIGKMFRFRIRMISFDNSIPYQVVSENEVSDPTYAPQSDNSGSFATVPGVDNVYEVTLPKSVNGTIFRLILGPTVNPFHRYDCQILVGDSGMESSNKWQSIR